MRVTFFGTRGSVPVASSEQVKFGGNTTCIQIESDCIPENHQIIVDAGSGFVPLSKLIISKGIPLDELVMHLLFTHYHHDHTQGLLLSPLTFIMSVMMRLYGPVEHGIGPREMMKAIMRPPFFPIEFKRVASHFHFKKFDLPDTNILIFHPMGVKQMALDQFMRLASSTNHVPVGNGKYPISDCLVVKMFKSHHPERTISYRFEEGPTGKVFVFLTDHENQDGVPVDLHDHVVGANLLVMDGQYTQHKYETKTCGFGHGSSHYCARLGFKCLVKSLGLTHHDPLNTDEQIELIVEETRTMLRQLNEGTEEITLREDNVFACTDYQMVEV